LVHVISVSWLGREESDVFGLARETIWRCRRALRGTRRAPWRTWPVAAAWRRSAVAARRWLAAHSACGFGRV